MAPGFPPEHDGFAMGWFDEAHQQFDRGRFPGAIRSKETVDLAPGNVHGQIIQRGDRSISLRQVPGGDRQLTG